MSRSDEATELEPELEEDGALALVRVVDVRLEVLARSGEEGR